MNLIKFLVLIAFVVSLLYDGNFVDAKKSKKSKSKKKSKITNTIFPSKPEGTTDEKPKIKLPITQRRTSEPMEYIPSEILAKIKGLNDIGSFIKKFNPAGVESKGKVLKYITNGKAVEMEKPEEQDTGCKPRMKVEKVTEIGSYLFPSCEEVPRCGGCCSLPNHICEPVDFKEVTVPTFRIPHGGIARFDTRKAIHHTKCSCNCEIKEQDCCSTQTFDADNCQCVCKDQRRDCGPNEYWSYHTCGCKCALNPIKCSSWKKTWNDEACGCVCIKTPESCERKGKTLSTVNCKCI